MAEKNIQMQRKNGDGSFDTYYPLTKAAIVDVADAGGIISATDVEGALQEIMTKANSAFQFANDGKTNIASVIGSPATSGDTFAQLTGHVQISKNTLATNLTAKGQSSVGTETLSDLVGKVANIQTQTQTGFDFNTLSGTMLFNYSNRDVIKTETGYMQLRQNALTETYKYFYDNNFNLLSMTPLLSVEANVTRTTFSLYDEYFACLKKWLDYSMGLIDSAIEKYSYDGTLLYQAPMGVDYQPIFIEGASMKTFSLAGSYGYIFRSNYVLEAAIYLISNSYHAFSAGFLTENMLLLGDGVEANIYKYTVGVGWNVIQTSTSSGPAFLLKSLMGCVLRGNQ